MITHRPHGVEHPYATSPDQRVPVLPLTGTPVRLGAIVSPDITRVTCEWGDAELILEPVQANAADAAALAGGEGHLSAAQAGALGDDGGWSVITPPVTEPVRYRFRAERDASEGRTAGVSAEGDAGVSAERAGAAPSGERAGGAELAVTAEGGLDSNVVRGAAAGGGADGSAASQATSAEGVEFTEWFEVAPAAWVSGGGEVRGGEGRVQRVEWLVSERGVHRAQVCVAAGGG